MTLFVFLLICVFLISPNESARILAVFPVPSISHQVVFRPLTQELAKRGHELVIITPDPAFPKGKTPANITEIDIHDISYEVWHKYFISQTSKDNQDDILSQTQIILNTIIALVDHQLQHEEVKKLINDTTKKFDLLLLEDCVKPALVFSNIYKVPTILVSSLGDIPGDSDIMGAPNHPLLYTGLLRLKHYNMSLWDKIKEIYHFYKMRRLFETHEKSTDVMLRKHFGNIPNIAELKNNVHMLFLNVYPVYDGIRPTPPTVVYMGGLHQKPSRELPKDLKSFLDSSKNGVIYMSFGTNVDTSLLPPEKIQAFVKVFSQLPYDVLWKWNEDELPGRTDNIRISKWLPQSDLLKHPKIKLFITQGGLQSTDEAITAGVPLIGIPMLADQWYNAEKYVHNKMGLKLDLDNITEENLKNAINTVIEDETYRRNVVKMRELMNDQPQRPLERAVWWTEHVLRHGGAKHLRSPAANMSWTEYLELELVFVLLGASLTIITLIVLTLYYLYTKIKSRICSEKMKSP